MRKDILGRPTQTLLFFVLLTACLYFAKPFLIPVFLAWLLALLFVPVSNKLEQRGWKRGLATLVCVLAIVAAIGGLVTVLGFQLRGLAKDTTQIETKVKGKIAELQGYISEHFGISPQKQQEMVKKQKGGSGDGGGQAGKIIGGVVAGALGTLGNFVLVMVYLFLFMYFRAHFKQFIMKAVAEQNKAKTEKILKESGVAVQRYLGGLSLMIVCLWVMYGIGFSIAGIKYALFFAVLCGLLEIVPFIGNLTGSFLTLLMALAQGDNGAIIGVIITYALVQFIQTYLLEPLVVGAGVKIHPAFTIMAIVVGELVWGVAGMVMALPILAIVKIVLDKISELKPYGFLVGNEKEE